MRTEIPEKLLRIVEDIDANGSAELTRLTVLKKWFGRSERLVPFAVWVAARATSRKGKTKGEAATLFAEARTLLKGLNGMRPEFDRARAQRLYSGLKAFQNEYERQRWERARREELEPTDNRKGVGRDAGLRVRTKQRLSVGSRLLPAL